MSRVLQLIGRLSVGTTTVTVLALALAAWSFYPRASAEADQPPQAVRGGLQLALDRLQVRLTGEQIADAVSVRQSGLPSQRLVVERIEGALADVSPPPSAVRLWLADRLFVRDSKPTAVVSLVLFHERTTEPAEALGVGKSVPARNERLGSAWYTSETHVATLDAETPRQWSLRGTTPIFDKRGLAVAMAEVRVATPREVPLPLWPRNVMLAVLAAALVAFWELRLALVRVLLNDVFGLRLSAAVMDGGETMSAGQRQMRDEIDQLASEAEAGNRLWLVRPGFDASAPETLFRENLGLELPDVRTCREASSPGRPSAEVPSGDAATVDLPPAGQTVVAAAIEDEHLLRRLLEVLLPHVAGGSGDATGQTGGLPAHLGELGNLSLRIVIEIRRREAAATALEGPDGRKKRPLA
jgi:hypothetical protein